MKEEYPQKIQSLEKQIQDQIDENLEIQEAQLKQNQKYEDQISKNQSKYDAELKKSNAKFNRLKTIAQREIAFLKAELKQLGEFVKLYARRANEEMKAQVSKVKAFLDEFTEQSIRNEVQISETKDDR